MSEVYAYHAGTLPLLISVPHDGREIPEEIAAGMTAAGRAIPDTDWHVARLYDFARDMGAAMIVARYSRYVVDLNRPPDNDSLYPGQLATGLVPRRTFAGARIYANDEPVDVSERLDRYWHPYHGRIAQTLAEFKEAFGLALLWDAHSIASRVPALFDGTLPVLNLGSWSGKSCDGEIASAVESVAIDSEYSAVRDGRFTGGYITRCYGRPANDVHALQLELAQRAYMNETTRRFDGARATRLRATLRRMLDAFTAAAMRVKT